MHLNENATADLSTLVSDNIATIEKLSSGRRIVNLPLIQYSDQSGDLMSKSHAPIVQRRTGDRRHALPGGTVHKVWLEGHQHLPAAPSGTRRRLATRIPAVGPNWVDAAQVTTAQVHRGWSVTATVAACCPRQFYMGLPLRGRCHRQRKAGQAPDCGRRVHPMKLIECGNR